MTFSAVMLNDWICRHFILQSLERTFFAISVDLLWISSACIVTTVIHVWFCIIRKSYVFPCRAWLVIPRSWAVLTRAIHCKICMVWIFELLKKLAFSIRACATSWAVSVSLRTKPFPFCFWIFVPVSSAFVVLPGVKPYSFLLSCTQIFRRYYMELN